ncbi:hypothetical protein PSQ40_04850 [Curvibacter sp. HBC61]|uniref:Uncharacterized protein n=1 Tax=Curvibacter cyanobacteriorum TaxID=3026422 RepID=A0ABT5MX33_9BURK|nr:hypothetical protein [Curvibacter sp. HBC61]MDD0837894.1 hypothetical protein [Curvibacter sp. HBC61]
MAKPKRPAARTRTYTLLHEISASRTETLPKHWQDTQLSSMWDGLAQLKQSAATTDDWRVCSDAVNLMETFITEGPWLDCDGAQVEIQDERGLLKDAVTIMAVAGKRSRTGQPLYLDEAEAAIVAGLLEDYAALIGVLPQRTMIRCHRLTEARLHEILAGKRKPHDVEIVTV